MFSEKIEFEKSSLCKVRFKENGFRETFGEAGVRGVPDPTRPDRVRRRNFLAAATLWPIRCKIFGHRKWRRKKFAA